MCVNDVKLELLQSDDRENFIKDNQRAFKYGALEEFGLRDYHLYSFLCKQVRISCGRIF